MRKKKKCAKNSRSYFDHQVAQLSEGSKGRKIVNDHPRYASTSDLLGACTSLSLALVSPRSVLVAWLKDERGPL